MSSRLPGGLGPIQLARLLWHLPSFARVFMRLMADRRVRWWVKLIPLAAATYVLVPLDLDWIPVVGWLDDAALVTLCARTFIRLCPPEVVAEHVHAVDSSR